MNKMTRISAFILLLSMALSGCGKQNAAPVDLRIDAGAADEKMEAYVDEAAALLQENGKRAEAVWPGYRLPQNAIILCQRDEETNAVIRGWMLTTAGKQSLTNEDLAGVEIPAAGGYQSTTFDGRKSIIISVSDSTIPALEKVAIANFIYEIGVHEMVHFHYESPFKLMKLAREQEAHGGRGTTFPKAAEPRVYRKMLYDNLAAAYATPEEEAQYLSRAKYWNEKWKADYPGEYYQAKVTDIMEGKARYIQYMLCMPGGLSGEEQAAWIRDHFDNSPEPSVAIDSESYKLGFVAGALLDRRETGWKEQLSKKPEPMVDYLLKDIQPLEDHPENYEEMLKTAQTQMARVNEELDAKLADVKKTEQDLTIPLLQLSDKYLAGSFETSDFINYGNRKVTVDFGGTFENKNGSVIVSCISVFQEGGNYLVPLTMAFEVENGRLTVQDESLTGDISIKQTTDDSGRTVYIMK